MSANLVFIGPNGIRPGWRLTLFLIVFALLSALFGLLGHSIQRLSTEVSRFVGTAISALAVFLATWIMSRLEHRSVSFYGFIAVNRGRNFLGGMAAGFAGISLLMGLLVAFGAAHLGAPDRDALVWGVYWLAFFLLVGFFEEMLTRGYALYTIAQGIGFWPAALILSIVFGLGHLGNGGEQTVGIVNAMFAGLVFAYTVRWTGSLWWAIGCHMTWDWGETFFYGVADSGIRAEHHLFNGSPSGAGWLSGGSVGPEGSILCALVLALLALTVRFTAPHYRADGLDRPKPTPPPPAASPQSSGPDEIPPPASSPSTSPSTYSAGSDDTN